MAKYIKTEEGYKLLNEIEGNVALTAGDFIEVKDNTIRATFGDLITAVSEEMLFNDIILDEDYYESISGYQSEIGTYDTDPKVGDTYQIEITTISGIVSYGQGKVVPSDRDIGRYEVDFGNIYSTIRLVWIYNNGLVVRSSFNSLRGCSVKVCKMASELKRVTLPKAALSYDEVPTENSDNLLTSGSIYLSEEAIKDGIKVIEEEIETIDEKMQSLISSLEMDNEVLHQLIYTNDIRESSTVIGFDLIELGAEYIVIFDDIKYRLPCVQDNDNMLYIGNPIEDINSTSTYPFKIKQVPSSGTATFNAFTYIYTTGNGHTCTLYKIETEKVLVTDYASNLKEKHDTEVSELRDLIKQLQTKVQNLENSQPSTSGETIIDGTYTFELNEEMGGYVLSDTVELDIEDIKPYMEVYEVSLDDFTEEFAFAFVNNGIIFFMGAETESVMGYIPESGQIIFGGDDMPNLSGEHKVVIKKVSVANDQYVIRIADEGRLAWFVLKDAVEGEATVKAVNQNQEELCDITLNLSYSEPHFYSDFIYSGSGHEKNMEAVFSALQAGDAVTIHITQMVDGVGVTEDYGGIIPGYAPSSRYSNTPQYYWGNKYIPCSS